MANTIKLNVSMEVPLIRLADLICEGFEGGVGYWATIVKYDEPKELKYTMDTLEEKKFGEPRVYKHIDYPLNEGGAVYIMETGDDEHGPIHKLDYEALMRGFKIMQDKWPRHFANWISENDDAETGDVFIQCCVLGDIVYG